MALDLWTNIVNSDFASKIFPSIFVGMIMFYNGVLYQKRTSKKMLRIESYKNILKIFNDFKRTYKVYENGLTDVIMKFNIENQKILSKKSDVSPEESFNHKLSVETEVIGINSIFYNDYLGVVNSLENEKHYLQKKDLEVVRSFEEKIYMIHTYIIKGDVIPYMKIKYIKELYSVIEESTDEFTEYFQNKID